MIKDLDEFNSYQVALKLGESVWDIVSKWNYFEKDTIGKQFVKAADSIAANLSEGLGRYHYKETKNFQLLCSRFNVWNGDLAYQIL